MNILGNILGFPLRRLGWLGGGGNPFDLLARFGGSGVKANGAIESVDVGRLQYVDVETGHITEGSGVLTITMQTTPAWGELGWFCPDPTTRESLPVLIGNLNWSVFGANGAFIGYCSVSGINFTHIVDILAMRGFQSILALLTGGGTDVTLGITLFAATDYQLAIHPLDGGGALFYIKGGAFTSWTLLFVLLTGTTSQIRASFSNYNSNLAADNFRQAHIGVIQSALIDLSGAAYFAQSLGSELISNGNFETGDPPTGWTGGGTNPVLDGEADERTGGSGAQSLEVQRGAGGSGQIYAAQSLSVSAGDIIEFDGWFKNIDAGASGIGAYANSGSTAVVDFFNPAVWTRRIGMWRATGIDIRPYISTSADGQSGRFDDFSAKKLTLNSVVTAISNGIFIYDFVLPSSPIGGQVITFGYRVVDNDGVLTDGWAYEIIRNAGNTAWDGRLVRYIAGGRSVFTTQGGIGTPTRVEIRANGSAHDAWTQEGTNTPVKRGNTITDSNHSTQTGIQAVYSSAFTESSMRVRVYEVNSAAAAAKLDGVA